MCPFPSMRPSMTLIRRGILHLQAQEQIEIYGAAPVDAPLRFYFCGQSYDRECFSKRPRCQTDRLQSSPLAHKETPFHRRTYLVPPASQLVFSAEIPSHVHIVQ